MCHCTIDRVADTVVRQSLVQRYLGRRYSSATTSGFMSNGGSVLDGTASLTLIFALKFENVSFIL